MKTTFTLLLAALLWGAATPAPAQTAKASQAPTGTTGPFIGTNVLEIPAPPPGEGVAFVVRTNNLTRTIDCKNCKVVVTGNNNAVTVTGTCTRLTVAGNNNRISAAAVSSLNTPGHNNAVTWSGSPPTLANAGKNNLLKAN